MAGPHGTRSYPQPIGGLVLGGHINQFAHERACGKAIGAGHQYGGPDHDIPLTRNAGTDTGPVVSGEILDELGGVFILLAHEDPFLGHKHIFK